MITAGVVLDQYDDTRAEVVHSRFPQGGIPQLWKEAHIPDAASIPDEQYALVLVNDGVVMRKYAMTDPANTSISAFYFLECGNKLPREAQKVAAANLVEALSRHNIKPPVQLKKIAYDTGADYAASAVGSGALGAGLGSLIGGKKARGKGALIGAGIGAAMGVAGRRVNTRKNIRQDRLFAAMLDRGASPQQAMDISRKMASANNVVDVTGLEADPITKERPRPTKVSHYALIKEGQGLYPIGSFSDVSKAIDYFHRHEDDFSLEDRREYCTKVAARAEMLEIDVPSEIYRYAGTEKCAHSIEAGLFMRQMYIPTNESAHSVVTELQKKAQTMAPNLLVSVLEELDKEAGLVDHWDRGVPNPVATVYGEKIAADEEASEEMLWDEGGDRLTALQLRRMLQRGQMVMKLRQALPQELIDGMSKNPVQVFKSLPDPHKIHIARWANDNGDGRDPTHPAN